jgi:hypothetical protein
LLVLLGDELQFSQMMRIAERMKAVDSFATIWTVLDFGLVLGDCQLNRRNVKMMRIRLSLSSSSSWLRSMSTGDAVMNHTIAQVH